MSTTVTGYDPTLRFYATQYKQGGRTCYSLDLSLAQVATLIAEPDPAIVYPGNRRITPAHARGFGEYLRTKDDWIAPGILLRAPAMFDFDPQYEVEGSSFGIVGFPRINTTDLHVVDGQHRLLGIHLANRDIAAALDKARSGLAAARRQKAEPEVLAMYKREIAELSRQRKRLENDRIAVQIYVEPELARAEQMFVDVNENQLAPSASVRARFDSRQAVNRTMDLVLTHPLLAGRIDMERDRLGRSNTNLLSAKHVADLVRIMAVGPEGRISRRIEASLNEVELSRKVQAFLDVIAKSFVGYQRVIDGTLSPDVLRAQTMLGSPVVVRVLAGTYYILSSKGMTDDAIAEYFKTLNEDMCKPASPEWAARFDGAFEVGALAPSARRQDVKAVRDLLVETAGMSTE